MEHLAHPTRWPKHLISSPFIFGMIIPTLFLDVCLEIYHRICFPLYGIPYVKRSYYIVVDRQKLDYLDYLEKLFCAYCGYVNGVFNYAVAIAGETEKYWCGIMHAKETTQPHHDVFLPYGDREAYRKMVADAKKRSGSTRDGRFESSVFLFLVFSLWIFWLLLTKF